MYQNFSPILIFTGIAVILVAVPFLLQAILSPSKNKGGSKLESYECGEVSEGSAWVKFNVRFYIIAILFVVFDVETIFLFPWAIIYNQLPIFLFIEMVVFLGILIVGYFYVWKKGALEWV